MKRKIKQRGLLAPLVEYDDGAIEPGLPGLLHAPVDAISRMLTPGYDYSNTDKAARDAFDASSFAMTGGLAANAAGLVPKGAVGSAGARVYHGARNAFDGPLDPARALSADQVHFFAKTPELADKFARQITYPIRGPNNGPAVYPAKIADDARIFDPRDGDALEAVLAAMGDDPKDIWTSRSRKALRGGSWRAFEGEAATDAVRNLGYDGWTFTEKTPFDSVAMFPTGRVRSATTGERLYANPTNALAPYLATQQADRRKRTPGLLGEAR